uniref:Uncharacterized protein n=1 Tax=Acrobeloides nanus TaxID=290746 RepID=A0A914CLZ4_9BILA
MKVQLLLVLEVVLIHLAHVLEFRRNDGDVLYEEKFVDEGRNRLITLKLFVNYRKHPFRKPAGEISLRIETENLKESLKYSFINLAILPGSNVILNLKNNLEEELLKAYEEKRWETQAHKEHNHAE